MSMSILRSFSLAGILALAACGGGSSASDQPALAAAADEAMGPQICQPGVPDPRACDPADAKKTTICHLPPGNPANLHTLCVGDPAVPAHLAHGDHLGSCCGTITPPPVGHDGGTPPPGPGNTDMAGSGPIP